MDSGVLQRVEAQRAELETQIAKLRKSLRHWQTIELDYEGLKEEIIIHKESDHESRLQAARDFKAELVDDKELNSILTNNEGLQRTPAQINDLLTKRIEYVARNIETVRKQLVEAEKKRNVLLLAEKEEYREEAGLPLTEITEELDEDGNVVSSKVQRPGEGAAGLVGVLRQAGVTDIEEDGTVVKVAANGSTDDEAETTADVGAGIDAEASTYSIKNAELNDHDADVQRSHTEKTTTVDETTASIVTFEDSMDGAQSAVVAKNEHIQPDTVGTEPTNEDDTSSFVSSNPDDDEDEALFRQDMLDYQRRPLDDIGAIVAELDLAEDASDVSYDPDDENFDVGSEVDSDLDDEESEDDTGKSKHPIIPEEYRRKMEELEKKLNIKELQNLGPAPEDLPDAVREQLDRVSAREAARKATLARHDKAAAAEEDAVAVDKSEDTNESSLKSKPTDKTSVKEKKKVAFSDTLDIAQESNPPPQPTSEPKQKPPSSDEAINPVSSTIVERASKAPPPSPTPTPQPQQKKEKVSRFKSSLTKSPAEAEAPNIHRIPQGVDRLVAPNLVERAPSSKRPPRAPELDEVDEELHKRQIAEQFQKLRNRRNHAQGGFVEDEEEEEQRGYDGGGKKVSRFKSARMKS